MTTLPIPAELQQQLTNLSPTQLAFLAGYAWAQSQHGSATVQTEDVGQSAPVRTIHILSASQTGNARGIAEQLTAKLQTAGLNASHSHVGNYKAKKLPEEDIIILITSTQGEGEPPEEAVSLYKALYGKKAPRLDHLTYCVLALGDRSYPQYCQAGKDFDQQFSALGAQRLLTRVDCDLDYQQTAAEWIDSVNHALQSLAAPTAEKRTAVNTQSSTTYSKNTPYAATLLARQKITAREAAKNVQHIEIDLGDSGIAYQPGDALGVWYQNAPELVQEILDQHQLSGEESVQLSGETLSIATALRDKLDITTTTSAVAEQYAVYVPELVDKICPEYLAITPPVALFHDYPHALDAQALADVFRPLTPRLYSIASAQAEVDDCVHLTVGVVEYQHHGRNYTGGASGFLGQTLQEDQTVSVYIEANPRFRLPDDPNTDIIMIGAGTGIAPFRAFMQQRENDAASGENWLIFGNTKFTDDFLYQAEWLAWRDSGLLTRADLAWSRQSEEKVYVQHKLAAAGADIWQKLQQGAHIYVCGDAKNMAKAVEHTLIDLIASQGQMSAEAAEEWLDNLRDNNRYQRDVY